VTDTQLRSPTARGVRFDDAMLHVDVADGRTLSIPLKWYPWLERLSPIERERYELIGDGTGIWWAVPDEGLSVPALFGLSCE